MQDEKSDKLTLGSAIDQMLAILKPLDKRSRRTALKAVCGQLAIVLHQCTQHAASGAGSSESPEPLTRVESGSTRSVDIRSFAQEKAPSSAIEQTVLVAYYLSELAPLGERKDSINKDDLIKYFKQAGFELPKRPEQTLVNARHAGYLESAGKGKYRLNPVGHNLIAHNLPRGEATQERSKKSPRLKKGKTSR